MEQSRAPASDPFEAYRARARFGNLDGLRFVCIAMVLWHHSPPLTQDVLTLFGRGFFGVNFFFILSGFLRQPIIARLGEISYGIYLYHLIALTVITRALDGLGPWGVFAAYAVLAALMAEISFRTLERWFQQFRPRTSA